MIKLKEIRYGYKRGQVVLDGITLDMKPGNIYGILGKNGVGKSTMLKIICGLLEPQGSCEVNGMRPFDRTTEFLQQISFIPEVPVVPDLKIEDLKKVTAPFYPTFDNDLFERVLTEFEVPRQKRLTQLSLGQQKKALISLSLACNTPILIMDEPTNGLDIPSKSIFRRIIASIADENRTIMISTHQVRDLENLINAVIILENHDVLLNSTLGEIEDRLYFGPVTAEDKPLYTDSSVKGVWGVMENTTGEPGNVDMEMLFNAVIENKTLIKNLFKAN